ncbi:MAG: hypothetical protein JST05_06330 [Acidobacteria bacterium]|nr:hypothetical protein [Acidobacteriota bacterium]
MRRPIIVGFALAALLACTPPTQMMVKQKQVALVVDMNPKAASALSADQVAQIADLYRDALRAELAPNAEVLNGPAADDSVPQVVVRIDALEPPTLEKGLLKAWLSDTTMDLVVAPLLATKGIEAQSGDGDILDRTIQRSVNKHRLAQLDYRPFILVGSVSFFDEVHRYDEDLDGWKLLTLMRPIAADRPGEDEAMTIRREEARALAMDVKARLDSRSNWAVSLRHPPTPPAWLPMPKQHP